MSDDLFPEPDDSTDTGNGKGRVSSRVLRAALDAVAKGDATAEIASDWVLANALPGDETPAEDVEANVPEGEQDDAEPEATWDSPWTDEEEAESNDTDWGPDA